MSYIQKSNLRQRIVQLISKRREKKTPTGALLLGQPIKLRMDPHLKFQHLNHDVIHKKVLLVLQDLGKILCTGQMFSFSILLHKRGQIQLLQKIKNMNKKSQQEKRGDQIRLASAQCLMILWLLSRMVAMEHQVLSLDICINITCPSLDQATIQRMILVIVKNASQMHIGLPTLLVDLTLILLLKLMFNVAQN